LITKSGGGNKTGTFAKMRLVSEADDDDAFLGEDMMNDEDEDKDYQTELQSQKESKIRKRNFMKSSKTKGLITDTVQEDSKWETIETTVLNGHEIEQDAGVILDDRHSESKSSKKIQLGGCMRRSLSRKLSETKHCDGQTTCSEQFWTGKSQNIGDKP